jgi:hypothetical protein
MSSWRTFWIGISVERPSALQSVRNPVHPNDTDGLSRWANPLKSGN